MSSAIGLVKRLYRVFNPPQSAVTATTTEVTSSRLRFGILGAANIAPLALIRPALTHPEVEVYAVAARDPVRATAYAKKWNIPKVHTSYQDLLNDPDVDVVYNPLPNGLHYEWTMKALAEGKHVLLEKPSSNTAEETRKMFELAESKGLVLLEAFHYRFHPAVQRVKDILKSNELGNIKQVYASLSLPNGAFQPTDIRFDYELGGGSLMDMGCYSLNAVRYLTSSDPLEVISAKHEPFLPANPPAEYAQLVDRTTTATLSIPNGITGIVHSDLAVPRRFGFIPSMPTVDASVECEHGTIELFNFVLPTIYHSIAVTRIDDNGRKTVRTEKVYVFSDDNQARVKGEEWWTTYRYQLEAFVDKLKGREPQTWVTKEDSIANIEWIEKIYDKTGLGSRPKSAYVHEMS